MVGFSRWNSHFPAFCWFDFPRFFSISKDLIFVVCSAYYPRSSLTHAEGTRAGEFFFPLSLQMPRFYPQRYCLSFLRFSCYNRRQWRTLSCHPTAVHSATPPGPLFGFRRTLRPSFNCVLDPFFCWKRSTFSFASPYFATLTRF